MMTKFLAVAIALSLAFAACKKKEDKVADPPKTDTTTTAPSGSAPAPAATPGLPEECARHKALAERFGNCEKLAPDARAGVKSSWAMMTRSLAGYDTMSAADQATAKQNCTTAADALQAFEKDCP
jgi:hypothetical protein